ncbi:hypothetical protein T3F96_12660 [Escherichia coli]|nr:hypothetical protein [Escherichia coli]EIQ6342452.1 hypothetical protein [Escherichia coli]MCV8798550.1 hypothetical protein [Escherichia coli]MDT4610219.1 hypothetical protein [Escherichia coli]MDZ3863064.1 hypothetical protein [Escherichia coli]HDV7974025.1 hypothetical protein [Escherichia coli]
MKINDKILHYEGLN